MKITLLILTFIAVAVCANILIIHYIINKEKYDMPIFYNILAFISLMFLGLMVIINIEHNNYKQGQIDALNGKWKYEKKILQTYEITKDSVYIKKDNKWMHERLTKNVNTDTVYSNLY